MPNSPARLAIDVGAVVDGTYTIEQLIGRGGMGEVFLASHNRLAGKKVAIKMLHPDLGSASDSAETLARFKREADIASQLDHPNIVKVEDYKLLPDGTPYIVYEYLQGVSLAQRLKDVGALPIDQTMSILRQVGSALAAAHRAGIVHRDLKPQNIFLCPSEVDGRAAEQAKVLDFGISKLRGSQTVKTQESSLLGTPQYMAPEQATGQHSIVDERTDIFALGAIVYEMLAGHPAFTGASIPEVVFKVVYEEPVPLATEVAALPAAIVGAVAKAMKKAATDRFATMSEFIEALTGAPLGVMRGPTASVPPGDRKQPALDVFAQTMDSGASPPSVPPAEHSVKIVTGAATLDMPEPAPRRSPLMIAGVVLGAVVVGGIVFFALRDRGHPEPRPERTDQAASLHREPAPPPPVDRDMKPEPVERDPGTAPPEAATTPAPAATPEPVAKSVPAQSVPAKSVPAKSEAKPAPAKTEPVETGDETSAGKLREAETAVHDHNYERAEQLASSVLASESASGMQKAHAYALRGLAACTVHHSEENARIALRQLADFPRFRRRLVTGCRAEGYLTSESP